MEERIRARIAELLAVEAEAETRLIAIRTAIMELRGLLEEGKATPSDESPEGVKQATDSNT